MPIVSNLVVAVVLTGSMRKEEAPTERGQVYAVGREISHAQAVLQRV